MHVSYRRAARWACGLMGTALLLSGCDAAPGPAAVDARPPVLSAFSYSPDVVVVGQPPYDDVEGDEVRVDVQFSVHVDDPDGDVQDVGYVVLPPGAGGEPVARRRQAVDGPGRVDVAFDVGLPTAEVGVYTVLVYAVDAAGHLSNQVRGTFRLSADGEPPVIEEVVAEPEVVRPPTVLKLVAVVTDPDGRANISRVLVRTPSGFEADLLDDGTVFFSDGEELGRDDAAGDGRYTIVFDVPSATPGVQAFAFRAIDRAGLVSDVVVKEITVE